MFLSRKGKFHFSTFISPKSFFVCKPSWLIEVVCSGAKINSNYYHIPYLRGAEISDKLVLVSIQITPVFQSYAKYLYLPMYV